MSRMDLGVVARTATTLADELNFYATNSSEEGIRLFDDLASDSASDAGSVHSFADDPHSDSEADIQAELFHDGKIRWSKVDLAQFVLTPKGNGKVYVRYTKDGKVHDVGYFEGAEALVAEDRRELQENLDMYVLGGATNAEGYQELEISANE